MSNQWFESKPVVETRYKIQKEFAIYDKIKRFITGAVSKKYPWTITLPLACYEVPSCLL